MKEKAYAVAGTELSGKARVVNVRVVFWGRSAV